MFAHALKAFLAATLLPLLAGGCRSAPPALPNGVDAHEYNKPVSDNWLFNRLRGQDSQPAAPAANGAQAKPDSQVVAASATQPVTDPLAVEPGSHTTIVAPAGSKDDPLTPKKEEERSLFDLDNFSPDNIYKDMKKMAGYGPDEKIARTAYEEGERLYNEKKYAEAAEKFSTAVSRWPDTPLEEDSLFMLAECYYFSDQYNKANDTYSKLLKKYEFSRYLDRSVARLFAIGRYWEQLYDADPHWPTTPNLTDKKQPMFDTWGYAIKAYEQVRLNDPTGPLADDAVMATANTYFTHGRFADAAYNYDLIRKEYPKSEHLLDANKLAIQSKLQVYQGPMYDGTPLKEAGDVTQETLTQFPDKLGKDKQRLIDTKNKIVNQRAEQNWAVAQYYDDKAYYGSARLYYQEVIKNYPQTEIAAKARARLEEIKNLPDEPPNYFKPLSDLLNTRPKLPPLQETPATKSVNLTP
jgi:outer membrane protein assembly factor BamD (BamD/ComL family)